MTAIKVAKVLNKRIAELPELDDFVGKTIEVIVLADKTSDEIGATSFEPHPRKRAGFAKGRIGLSEDFDTPLDDFKDYM